MNQNCKMYYFYIYRDLEILNYINVYINMILIMMMVVMIMIIVIIYYIIINYYYCCCCYCDNMI